MNFVPKRTPKSDPTHVGITFVDVLFALVVARVLDPWANRSLITWPGAWQLGLAGAITVTSWVGYHTSANRPSYRIQFPNLPLFQFLIDISLVVAYWMTAATAEVRSVSNEPLPRATALPETLFVMISF